MITPQSVRKGDSPSGLAANALSAQRFISYFFIRLFSFVAGA